MISLLSFQNITFIFLFSIFHQRIFAVLADIAILTPENSTVELYIDYKITYTPSIPENGLIGYLEHASPEDACSPIKPPPKKMENSTNWFVLAFRSSSFQPRCANRDKIRHAANAGYKAIIMYNQFDFNHQSSMSYLNFVDTNLTIPALLVSHTDGQSLRQKFLWQSNFRILITADIPPNISYLIPFVILIGVGILIITTYIGFQFIMCIMERRKEQKYRLPKKYLKKLPMRKFNKMDGFFYETCAICLEDYVDGERIRILPCNHAYHTKCIDPWLTKNRRVCPVCKAKVRVPGMPEYSDSDSESENRNINNSSEATPTTANERTRLLPSSSSASRFPRRNNNRTTTSNRSRLPNFSLLIDSRSEALFARAVPVLVSTNNYEPLDDTLAQPGPSTSAPITSQASSGLTGDVPSSHRFLSRRNKKRRAGKPENFQVVAAEIASLIAPAQLSINGDHTDSERPITPQNNNNNGTRTNLLRTNIAPAPASIVRTSVDEIV